MEIDEFEDADAGAFYALNRAWLDAYGLFEPADERQLADPRGEIIARGGAIFVARLDGRVVGTVALVPAGPLAFEVAKLAVDPSARGRGIGRRLVGRCVAAAREAGATRLTLVSSSRLHAALRLYERLGFVRAPVPSDLPYATADVFMVRAPL